MIAAKAAAESLLEVLAVRYGHLFPDDLDAVADAFDAAAGDLQAVPTLRWVRATKNAN